jgi:hypothetical protein
MLDSRETTFLSMTASTVELSACRSELESRFEEISVTELTVEDCARSVASREFEVLSTTALI